MQAPAPPKRMRARGVPSPTAMMVNTSGEKESRGGGPNPTNIDLRERWRKRGARDGEREVTKSCLKHVKHNSFKF